MKGLLPYVSIENVPVNQIRVVIVDYYYVCVHVDIHICLCVYMFSSIMVQDSLHIFSENLSPGPTAFYCLVDFSITYKGKAEPLGALNLCATKQG